MYKPEQLLILTTCPDVEIASRIATALVAAQLAACVQIGQAVESIYHWDNNICQSNEVPMQIKCMATDYHAIEQLVIQMHPYEVPEFIATPIIVGFGPYLQWIKDNSPS
ncbi:MAG: divalent-cation tolerance protein CutA [Shewanella psychromarinicola]|jgi:periplasmic divalent cation tolerance protein|uniref:Divalent-cation tolerance protein CutA n=1 Tax=Shewanella psychromarinicola TaxID=2487742 RepID=A0A3N4E9R1_9GAMM|nr:MULTISPECIES: divalent-cation tolerance protein CutA [Shewanella]AZG34671.1 divalent-cation tolerance protein CutA [Shewanella psychromarinicola]MCL1083060.1 divalent-cation tolerance protein CutA [Shewanella psychromarinicola]PKG79640.1 divalent-cation tolerance protein CutA [Shewanella sp. Actino-trap-3]RPA33542.1 divalent-cation tolerance protein CutA [Shewanella psychromarinicola]|tara:strand:+ start:5122 stop:5448 length:327 start_codon:yes stop_codon:yes gene_type:complete